MDRKIVYPAQIPLVEDQLEQTRFIQKAFGFMAQALAGEGGTIATGLDCAPASGMTVTVAPGQVITPGAVDSTSYGVLAEDTTSILTQFLLTDAVTLTVPGVGATYLIYATPSVADQSNLVLPFYNSANPTQVYAGPDNNGASSATVRASILTVDIGTSVPSGAVPLWQIVVPSAATAITAAMISAASGAPLYPSLAATLPRTLAPFSASLAAAFGGYPLNAMVADTSTSGLFWRSTAAANMTVPGASGASWDATMLDQSLLDWTQIGASQYLTPPSWAKYIEVIQIGGGGGGAGCKGTSTSDSISGSGGAAGGVLRSRHLLTAGATVAQYVGSGGSGANGAVSGGKGGDTYLVLAGVTVATAGGGDGGYAYASGGAAGGSGGTNTLVSGGLIGSYPGSDGGDGQVGTWAFPGNGAPGYLGAGAGRAGSGGGQPASSPGAGGGGAYDGGQTGNSYAGGTGAAGACLYRWIP